MFAQPLLINMTVISPWFQNYHSKNQLPEQNYMPSSHKFCSLSPHMILFCHNKKKKQENEGISKFIFPKLINKILWYSAWLYSWLVSQMSESAWVMFVLEFHLLCWVIFSDSDLTCHIAWHNRLLKRNTRIYNMILYG